MLSFLNSIMPFVCLATEEVAKKSGGLFSSIGILFSNLLTFFFNFTGDWGWAIILFTIFTKLLLLPLTIKQTRSMREIQRLQPEMMKIQEKYKNDKETQQMKLMEFYKEHKINPMAGCLPLLIQFPILMAVYRAVLSMDALSGAKFLWIGDLGAPNIPLVILTGIIMFAQMQVQQKLSGQAQQNQMMNLIMPVMIVIIGFKLPAGAILYWAVSNLVAVAQTFFMYSRKEPVEKEAQ